MRSIAAAYICRSSSRPVPPPIKCSSLPRSLSLPSTLVHIHVLLSLVSGTMPARYLSAAIPSIESNDVSCEKGFFLRFRSPRREHLNPWPGRRPSEGIPNVGSSIGEA